MNWNAKRIALVAVPALLVAVVFQNCASDSLPNEAYKKSSPSNSNFSAAAAGGDFNSNGGGTTKCQFFLDSGNTWKVPNDFNPNNNTIEAVGNGADAGGNVRAGGGGGAYSKSVNVVLTPGATVAYSVAHIPMSWPGDSTGGHTVRTSAGDSYFCNSTANCTSMQSGAVVVGAAGGTNSINGPYGGNSIDGVGGLGGSATAGIALGTGSLKYSGGNGGNCANLDCSYNPATSPGSGGGAAGPHGDGMPGGAGAGMGGAGDAGYGGAGGGISLPGANGTYWDANHGIGGGGGGSAHGVGGSRGGKYGGGGGGGGNDAYGTNPAADASGIGGGGLIVVTYFGTTCN